jgi:transcription-repair coupling factor (superfamily II helicase)
MSLYRRISSLKTEKNIDELSAELRDRFGPLPEEVSSLLAVMRLKLVARELMTLKIQTVQERVRVVFSPETPVQPEMVFNLHEAWKGRMQFLPDGFEIDMKKRDADTMLAEIYQASDALRQALPVA